MTKNNKVYRKSALKISDIQPTSERLTGRAGLTFFVAYLHSIQIFSMLERFFGSLRKSKKGTDITELFKQILCFMMDGTSRHLVYFDHLKNDAGYAGTIETDMKELASSHTIKRFFKGFSFVRVYLFRRFLHNLFIWRLKIVQPPVIELGIDTMVLDNDDADCRHGVKPTYKKKKGFQPLQMNWGRYFVDAVFRGGDKHSNHGNTVEKMIRHMVNKIRKSYRMDVPIIIRLDSGFFDQKIFEVCEELHVGYICGGKLYKDIIELGKTATCWQSFASSKKKDIWEYAEFGCKRGSWKRFRRALYCRLLNKDKQLYLPGTRPDTVIITNLGLGGRIDELLGQTGNADYLNCDAILACYHERGSDELANRALKNFGHEQLPFKRFTANSAWYYMMLVGHFLFESFKEDVVSPVISVNAYADTVRRQFIDIAGKVVSHSGKIILKVASACFERLQLSKLLDRCSQSPVLQT
jgi:hypothetical protein